MVGQIDGVSRDESGRDLREQGPLALPFDCVMMKMINTEMVLDPIGVSQLSKKVAFFNGIRIQECPSVVKNQCRSPSTFGAQVGKEDEPPVLKPFSKLLKALIILDVRFLKPHYMYGVTIQKTAYLDLPIFQKVVADGDLGGQPVGVKSGYLGVSCGINHWLMVVSCRTSNRWWLVVCWFL